MIIHLQEPIRLSPSCVEEVAEQWDREGLIPFAMRFCDSLMMRRGQEDRFTKVLDRVTCKRCLKML